EQRGHLRVRHRPDLDPVFEAELRGVPEQSATLRAVTDDQQPRSLLECGESANHVEMALLPDEPPRRDDEMAFGGSRLCTAEALDVDAGIRDVDPLGRRTLEQQTPARALGRRQEEIRVLERVATVSAAPGGTERVSKRDRLPDREHEPEAEPLLQRGRMPTEPDPELGGVDDVCTGQVSLQIEVTVT